MSIPALFLLSRDSLPFYVPLTFVGLLIIITTILLFYALRQRKKHLQELKLFAAQNSWTFTEDPLKEIFQNYNDYSIFTRGKSNSRVLFDLLQKPFDGGQLSIFNYTYRTGSGKSSNIYTQTVFAFQTPHLNVPYFTLGPETFFSFIGELFVKKEIDFNSHSNFSRRYKLTGADEKSIRQIFYPQMLEVFEKLPDMNIDGGGNYLFIYTSDKQVEIQHLNESINNTIDIYNLFRR